MRFSLYGRLISGMFPKAEELRLLPRPRWQFVDYVGSPRLVHVGCKHGYYYDFLARNNIEETVCQWCKVKVPKEVLIQAELLDAIGYLPYVSEG